MPDVDTPPKLPWTEPHPAIFPSLDRTHPAVVLLARCAALLREDANWGSRLLATSMTAGEAAKTPRQGNVHAVRSAMLRWIVELLAASSDLMSNGWVDPAILTLRSMFEASLGLEFMLAENSERRAAAYLVARTHRRIAELSRLDPKTDAGRQVLEKLRKDKQLGREYEPPDLAKIHAEVALLRAAMEQPEVRDAVEAYAACKKEKKGNPDWQELCGGSRGVDGLAADIGRTVEYEFFYRKWSTLTHGGDTVTGKFITPREGVGVALKQIGLIADAPEVTTHAARLALMAFMATAKSISPECVRATAEWHQSIRHEYVGLIHARINQE